MLVVRTISLDQIDQSHEFMPGMAKYYFDQAGERLQKDVEIDGYYKVFNKEPKNAQTV